MAAKDHAGDDVSRRDFLGQAGTALGGLRVAAGLGATSVLGAVGFDAVAPRVASAQQVRKRPQRVAVVGADHYHATSTPNYLRILQGQKVDIVGVHAPDAAIAAKWASQYGSTP